MTEPLKDKVECQNGYPHICEGDRDSCWRYYSEHNVKSAVEWYKKRIEDHRPDFRWTKKEILEIINAAFPDLCPSGDLIADKQQNPPEDNRTRCPKCNMLIFTAFKSERCDCAD